YTAARNEWVRGRIEVCRSDREAAFARFESARSQFEALDCPYETARVLFDIGLLHESPDEATEVIRGAIGVFERLHAALDLERARGALFRIRPAGKAAAQNVVGLYEIVKIINSTLQVEEVLNRVLDICLRRLRAERGLILLLDPITGALRTRIARNISDAADARSSPQGIVREVIQSGAAIVCADAGSDERFSASESVSAEHILSIACVPLIIRERIGGAIYVDHRQARNLFSDRELTFLEAFADQAAIAIENARLYEELEEARARLSAENETLRKELLVEKHLDSIVGESDEVARIQFAIRKAAAGHSTVLVRGESGTGKGLVARIIHNVGPRRNGPFIKFNCAALPETLAESELFGHEKGAFTGADRRKLGRFELAHHGTIFLDEIGKLSLAMQAKLLRVVEEKEFERVGGVQTIRTDVKIIAATNLDLERAILDGTFREDLFYRLNIVPITLPPLRERKQDIAVLAEHFMRKICKDLGLDLKRLQPGIIDMFHTYDWPGNVRELEATLHRAIVMANGETITRDEIAALFGGTAMAAAVLAKGGGPGAQEQAAADVDLTSDHYESQLAGLDKELITRALAQSGGRIREAARRLGLARNTLKAKMQRYQIQGRDN
ncbi:MAG: sigma 54-interacting transcriptional regulator, partial [Thermoanaerobaculia bacterium]